MKKNKIKWYSYMAFILSSPYILESCASSVDNNNMIRNEANISCNELYPKKQNELTQINEFSDSSLGSESSTKSIKEASDESNILTENKEESSSEESDNVFQNSDPYADLSKAVNYSDFRGFIKGCKKRAEENKKKSENEDILEEYLSQEGLLWQHFSKEEFTEIQKFIKTILSKRQQADLTYESKNQNEDTSVYTYDKDISSIINQISTLKKGDSLLLSKESYKELFDLSNQGTQKKKICNRKNITLEKDNSIVEPYESWDYVVALYIDGNKFKMLVSYITEEDYIWKVTKL